MSELFKRQEVAALKEASPEARITYLQSSRFFIYPRVEKILLELEELVVAPVSLRPPNVLILGNSNAGKTELLQRFIARHPATERPDSDAIHVPVFELVAPPEPDLEMFLDDALLRVGIIPTNSMKPRKKIQLLMNALQKNETRVLVLDEVHTLLAGPSTKTRLMMNLLKYISNKTKVSLVLAGTGGARQALNTDKELESRFPERPIPPLQSNGEFKSILQLFEAALPLKTASNLHAGESATLIYANCDMQLGGISKMVRDCAIRAIKKGNDAISVEILKQWIAEKEARARDSALII